MKSAFKLTFWVYLLVAVAACTKEDENLNREQPLGLGGDTWAKGPLDQWLYDSITKPYNIEVKYRWDPWEVNLDKTLVPPEESKVIPAMSAIKQIWIDPFNAETGSDVFIKTYSPKTFVLVGSPEYNYNGTIVLGQAEGGKKITMFVINNFDKSNITELRRMLHTIEHEFAHILHQNVLYPQDYKTITPGYTSTWFNISDATAQSQGFATAYAMASPDEDFVEMIATMLVEGRQRFNEMVSAQPAAAQSAFRQKEDIVVTYFRQVWNIDFYSLQRRTQEALNRISPDPLEMYYGFGKKYTTVSVNPANTLLIQSPGFTAVFNQAKTGLAALGGAGYVLDSMAVITTAPNTVQLRLYFHNAAGTANLQANYNYTLTKGANNIYSFTYAGADANGSAIAGGVTALTDYFKNNQFKIDWFINPNNTLNPLRVVFTPQQTPNASFTGLLLK